MISRTTCVELYKFFTSILKREPVSKQAFSQARKNLNHKVFMDLNELFLKGYYEEDFKTYKNYLIFSCDGTSLKLPKEKEFIRDFGCPSNQKGEVDRPLALSSILLDINNQIIINGIIEKNSGNEKEMMLRHIEKIKTIKVLKDKKIIILFDRGYPSMELITKLSENNIDFIIRGKRNFIKHIAIASKYSKYDRIKKVKITYGMWQGKPWFKNYAKEKNYEMNLRIVTGKMKDGISVFMTNLSNDICNREEIVELYRRRWEIETHFRHEKETCEFENFSCKTTFRLYQEYFCKLYTLNFASLLIEVAQDKVNEKIQKGIINSKYELKINRNVAIGLIKDNIYRIIFDESDEYKYLLISEIAKHTIPVIKGRIFKRKFLPKVKYNIPYRRAC